MKGYVLLGFAIAAALALLMVVLTPSVDDFSPDNPFWNGLTRFCSRFNVTPIAPEDAVGLPRGAALVILAPSRALDGQTASALRRFAEEGGLILVADDFGAGNAVLESLGVSARFSGGLLADAIFMYKSPYLPRAMAEVNGTSYELYLNYATSVVPGRGVCLARSSPFSFLDSNFNGRSDEGEPRGPFCVVYAERVGRGAVIAVSDPSIFINAMVGMGGNEPMLEAILAGRRVFLLSGVREASAYTAARARVLAALNTLFGTNLRYPVSLALAVAVYAALYTLARRKSAAEGERE